MKPKYIENKHIIICGCILIIGLLLRIIGVEWHDMYHNYQPDEGKFYRAVLYLLDNNTIYNRYNYIYPNQFSSKFVAFVLKMLSYSYNIDNLMAIRVYRIYTVIVSTVAVVPAYIIGEKIRKNRGWILAMLVSIFPGFCCISKMITGDMVGLTWQLCVLLFSLYYYKTAENSIKYKFLILMSIFSAMATLEKWNNASICILIAFVVFFKYKTNFKSIIVDGIISFGVWFLSLFVFAPNMFFDFKKVVEQSMYGLNYLGGEKYLYWRASIHLFVMYCGLVSVLMVIIGAISIITSKNHNAFISAVFGAISYFWLNLMMNRTIAERWTQPVNWGFIVLLFYGITWLIDSKVKFVKFIGYGSLIMITVNFFVGCLYIDTIALAGKSKDSRQIFDNLLQQRGITRDECLTGQYTVFDTRLDKDSSTKIITNNELNTYFSIEGNQACIDYDGGDFNYLILSNVFPKDGCFDRYGIAPIDVEPILVINSDIPDLFLNRTRFGHVHKLEVFSIIDSIKEMIRINNADCIGPTIKLWNIADAKWTIATK